MDDLLRGDCKARAQVGPEFGFGLAEALALALYGREGL